MSPVLLAEVGVGESALALSVFPTAVLGLPFETQSPLATANLAPAKLGAIAVGEGALGLVQPTAIKLGFPSDDDEALGLVQSVTVLGQARDDEETFSLLSTVPWVTNQVAGSEAAIGLLKFGPFQLGSAQEFESGIAKLP